jgi:hypothetical protein
VRGGEGWEERVGWCRKGRGGRIEDRGVQGVRGGSPDSLGEWVLYL